MSIHSNVRSHSSLSKIRPLSEYMDELNSRSVQADSVHVRRYCRRRSLKHQNQQDHQNKSEIQSKTVNSNVTQITNNAKKSSILQNNPNLESTLTNPSLNEKESNLKLMSEAKTTTHPSLFTDLMKHQFLSLFSNRNPWHNKDSNKRTKRKTTDLESATRIKQNDAWYDRTIFENGHRRRENRNKSNKCSQQRIIALIAISLALSIAIAITIGVLLSKSKAKSNGMGILRWNQEATTIAGVTGQSGNDSDLLFVPFGLVFDFSNTLYIADASNNRIQKYSMDDSYGITVAGQQNGSSNTTSDYLNFPSDVTIDSYGNLYITDSFNYRISLWTNGSSSGTILAGTGISGSTNDTFDIIYGIARDANSGTLYISDTGNHRVMRYLQGSSSGTVIAGGNGPGLSTTQLLNPMGLYFDSFTNSLMIANYGANNIVRWIIGETNWTLIAGDRQGLNGVNSNELNQPTDVTLDPMGNVYVVDMGNNRIQFFSNNESNGTTIAGVTSTNGNSSTLLNNPYSVALDSQLNLYVADTYNHRVQKFSRF